MAAQRPRPPLQRPLNIRRPALHSPLFTLHWLLALACVCWAGLTGCSDDDATAPVGPLPEVDLTALEPALAERLSAALAILRSKPEDASFNGEAGMLLHAYRRLDLAQAFYERARALEPDSLRWPYYLGVIHAGRGRHDAALAAFETSLAIDPTLLPARKRKARSLLEQRRLDESLLIYNELLEEAPDDPQIRNGLGKAHAALGNFEDAAAHLTRAVELSPNFGEAHYALALAYRDLGDEAKSSYHLKQHENDRFGGPSGADPLMAAIDKLNVSAAEYLKRGVEARGAGRIAEAVELHLKAVQADPGLVQAHLNLIVLYAGAGKPDLAESHYRQALALNPDSAELHYNYGVLSYDRGDFEAAAKAFRKALEINPDYAAANNNMGQMLEQQGRLDDAIGFYRRAVANRPDYGLAHYHLGRAMMQKQRPAEAVREFRLAAREETARTPAYLLALAAAYAALEETAEAADALALARRLAERYGQTALIERIDSESGKPATRSGR